MEELPLCDRCIEEMGKDRKFAATLLASMDAESRRWVERVLDRIQQLAK